MSRLNTQENTGTLGRVNKGQTGTKGKGDTRERVRAGCRRD